jgi:hypothetical protein
MSDGGKGSKARPFSISQQEYDNRWDYIFSRDLDDAKLEDEAFAAIKDQRIIDNTGTSKDEYYDVLTTEDALMAIYKN